MKTSHSLVLAALTATIVLIACNSSTSDNATAASTDTTSTAAATAGNTNDASTQEEANKKLVLEFYQSLYGDKDSNAIDKYIADDVKQHNPLLKDGKQWLKDALRPFLENPNIEKTKIEIPLVAQKVIKKIFKTFPGSYRCILDDVCQRLVSSETSDHEYKGESIGTQFGTSAHMATKHSA